jgi:hypothetical protein
MEWTSEYQDLSLHRHVRACIHAEWEVEMQDEKWRCRMRSGDAGWEVEMQDEKWKCRMRSGDAGWVAGMQDEKRKCRMRGRHAGKKIMDGWEKN